MITIKKYYRYYNKKLNNQPKKQKRANIFIQINIYNHAENGGQISGNGGQNANQGGQIAKKGGQNANQGGLIIKKYRKETKVRRNNLRKKSKGK
ncbi:hypothetical protein [Priestia megaterium]|uniref:hypothetical protein n=1 Tax=Priestia megaterium TaxID=1404 RepID=UPI001D56ACF6|nr:hypothetical protein [Priestia megaterium]CAH0314128.1 hypothetical protein SRABI82_05076 [Priestia megaterium]